MMTKFEFFDKPEDEERLQEFIDDFRNLIDHLRGEGIRGSRAPALMNRSIISSLEQRVKFCTVKLMAIQLFRKYSSRAQVARIIHNDLPGELAKYKIQDKNSIKSSTLEKWIAAEVSEVYPPPSKEG